MYNTLGAVQGNMTRERGPAGVFSAVRIASKSFSEAGKPGMLIQHFKDSNAEEGQRKRASQNSVAVLANEISTYLFGYLEGFRIPTHFVEKVSEADMLVHKLVMFPLEVQVHNVAAGSYARRFGLKEGLELSFPVIEHHYKKPDLGNPLVNEFHIYSMGVATPEQLRAINRLASKANVVLRSFFERRGLKLVSFVLEFGLSGSQIMIGDEISPRTCVLSDLQSKAKTGKHSFNGHEIDHSVIRNRVFGIV